MKMSTKTTTQTPNYRIYDRTGGGVTHDIYAPDEDAAIEAGREWIEDGDWSGDEDGEYRTIALGACVRPIVSRPTEPDILSKSNRWDLWCPVWDGARWGVDVSDIQGDDRTDAEERSAVAESLTELTGGEWQYEPDSERVVWVDVPADADTEDITDEQDSHDCSGEYAPEIPGCDAAEDGEHDWQADYDVVGGIRENPGVHSHGGTTMSFRTCCARCGRYKVETDYGSRHNETLSCVRIEDRDEASERWVLEQRREEIEAALTAAGLAPENLRSDNTYAVPDDQEDKDESVEYMREIEAALPKGLTVEWTGSSDTDADGDTSSDVRFGIK
jgi:hypothetical protein